MPSGFLPLLLQMGKAYSLTAVAVACSLFLHSDCTGACMCDNACSPDSLVLACGMCLVLWLLLRLLVYCFMRYGCYVSLCEYVIRSGWSGD